MAPGPDDVDDLTPDATVSRVDLPDFVSGVIKGTFDANVHTSLDQMNAYRDLVASVQDTPDQFRDNALDRIGNSAPEARAVLALREAGFAFSLTRHGPVRSLAEAAAARGVEPRDIVKTLVVRRTDDEYLFVLVPGDREISWPKLRAVVGVSRLSMPSADVALAVTGYERGTITPFGASTPWPVIADATIPGRTVSMGAGAHGVAATMSGDDLVRTLGAQVADVTDPLVPR